MSRAAVLLVLVVAIAYTTAFPQQPEGSQECGDNEVFNACGSTCVDTCKQRASPICTMECVIGCQCKAGYVRNDANQCVLTRDC